MWPKEEPLSREIKKKSQDARDDLVQATLLQSAVILREGSRGEAGVSASHGNLTTPKHPLKSQVYKKKGHLPVSDERCLRERRGLCQTET